MEPDGSEVVRLLHWVFTHPDLLLGALSIIGALTVLIWSWHMAPRVAKKVGSNGRENPGDGGQRLTEALLTANRASIEADAVRTVVASLATQQAEFRGEVCAKLGAVDQRLERVESETSRSGSILVLVAAKLGIDWKA